MLAAPSQAALPGFAGADSKATLEVCTTERAPLLERQKTYAAVRHEHVMTAAMASAKVGARMLLSSGVLSMLIPGAGLLSKALEVKNSAGGAGNTATSDADYAKAVQAVSVVVAIGGAVDAYVKVKQQQFNNDARRISQSIDTDAGLQIPTGEDTAKEMAALADCRANQVADYKAKLAAAGSDKERKDVGRGQAGLKAALKADIELTEDVMTQEATMVKTFGLGRAMAEGKSEADILESDKPALGGEPSMAVMALPPVEASNPQQPVIRASYVTVRATAARSAPSAQASVIMNFPAGRTVTPKGHAVADAGWWEVEVAGTPGFVAGADLADPSSVSAAPAPPPVPAPAAKGKAKGKASAKQVAPPPPPPPPPNNVRALNRAILAAKTEGVERLKALSLDIQAALTSPSQSAPLG